MKDYGTVIQLNNDRAIVSVKRRDECSKCGMCIFPKNADSIEFDAKNPIGAKVGDKVILQKAEGGKFLSAVLVFLVPVLLVALSAILGVFVIKNELWTALIGILAIILWYFILSFIDKAIKKRGKLSPVIIEILQKTDSEVK